MPAIYSPLFKFCSASALRRVYPAVVDESTDPSAGLTQMLSVWPGHITRLFHLCAFFAVLCSGITAAAAATAAACSFMAGNSIDTDCFDIASVCAAAKVAALLAICSALT